MGGIDSLISFSVILSFVSRRATDFCEFVLYPAAWLKVFINWRSLLVEFLGPLMYILNSTANKSSLNALTSSFHIYIFLISWSCLDVLVVKYYIE